MQLHFLDVPVCTEYLSGMALLKRSSNLFVEGGVTTRPGQFLPSCSGRREGIVAAKLEPAISDLLARPVTNYTTAARYFFMQVTNSLAEVNV